MMTLIEKQAELSVHDVFVKDAMSNQALFNDMRAAKRLAKHRAEFEKCVVSDRLIEITNELSNDNS